MDWQTFIISVMCASTVVTTLWAELFLDGGSDLDD